MSDMSDLLRDAYERSIAYQQSLATRSIFPTAEALAQLTAFDEPLPAQSQSAADTLALLDSCGSPATVASTKGTYFGFVTGGVWPVAHAVNWLATTWDQNGAVYATSPVTVHLERLVLGWLIDLFQLPEHTAGAFVSGATMANLTALAAARHALLERQGWNVEAQGLFGAPEIKVIVGAEVHISVLKALGMLGLGRERVIQVPVDQQGRMLADQLPELDSHTLICIQAGNVNSGAFDPARAICEQAQAAGAWVHVDGAFGLWALASPTYARLADGFALADSWSVDAHKWLNVPYDSGIALCRHPEAQRAAMSCYASYVMVSEQREPLDYGPEISRRARIIDTWAALRTLGRAGLQELIDRTCSFARQFAQALSTAGYTVHNDVVLNQVVVSFGDAQRTTAVIEAIQRDGVLWASKTVWQGHKALRLSVAHWATTQQELDACIASILRCAKAV